MNDKKTDEAPDAIKPEPVDTAPVVVDGPFEPEPLTGPAWLVHNSPAGALWVNGVGEVEPATPFEVGPALGTDLLRQHELFSLAKAPKGDAS